MKSDEALLARLRGGDLTAFDVLYQRYAAHLFGFIRAHLDDPSETEDVLHETFMTVLRERVAPTSLRSWVFQVARNACLNRLRTRRRASSALAKVDDARPVASAEEQLELLQRAQALDAAVRMLPAPLAELYHLRAQGLSYVELAEVLGLPLGTVKSRLHELVQRLSHEVSS